MLLLYWKIFRVINDRVRRNRLHNAPPSSSGTETMTSSQPPLTTWRRRAAGHWGFVRAVIDRLVSSYTSDCPVGLTD